MHQRPQPTLRTGLRNHNTSTPLLPSMKNPQFTIPVPPPDYGPTVFGLPLKYVSLVTLAVQNAALSIVMHYSRVSTPPSHAYSPASAVLLNELLKGSISLIIALCRTSPQNFLSQLLSPDCWKLSIPAMLYVVQNSLQFVAISNLPVASFQVTYQMKILTTAAFSVALLRKKMTSTKWLSLFFLAIGVAIVQIQTVSIDHATPPKAVGSAHDSAPLHIHVMSPLKGFGAVVAACFTSGLAGVYFEMVLKNSKADLWVRNVQLSLFSIIPALLPILCSPVSPDISNGFVADLFRNFGGWAWATVSIQVFGGLITAIVIKYSDNILKGFATSLSIIFSFLASVALFDFRITPWFVGGATVVLWATWMYNQPEGDQVVPTPLTREDPILGEFPPEKKKTPSPFGSPRALATALGFQTLEKEHREGEMLDVNRYHFAPYGSPYPSRAPSRAPTPRVPSPGSPSS